MGLEFVELVMEAEEKFGIKLPDSECGNCETVGDFVGLIKSRLQNRRYYACPTLRGFLMIRALVRQVMFDPKFKIHPKDRIEDLLSAQKRKQLWGLLQAKMEYGLPNLKRPFFLTYVLFMCVPLLAILFGWKLHSLSTSIAAIFVLSMISLPLLSYIAIIVTNPLRITPPENMKTFGDASRSLAVGLGLGVPQTVDLDSWILENVKDIIVDRFSVERQAILLTSRFIKDFGFG